MANTRATLGEQETLDGLINHTLTSIEEDGVDRLGNYALAYNTALTSVNFPGTKDTRQFTFQNCTELLSANFPAVITIGQLCFSGCTKLTTPVIGAATSLGNSMFQNCKALPGLDVPTTVSSIPTNCFNGCSAMTWLKLPKTSMVTLANVNAFTGTPISIGLGAIYVPAELVATYKANSSWKNFFIASIDDYPLTDFETIKDSWSEILAAEQDGTYSTKYAIGDTKKAVINGNDVYMQIVAFDADTLTGGSTAKITWIAKNFSETHRMNATGTNADGWAASGMRTWLHDTIYAGLDSDLKAAIKEVDKTYYDKTNNTTKTVSDTLWIPSYREVGLDTTNASCESSGPIYSDVFTSDNATRIKYNTTTLSTANWWLRSAHSIYTYTFMSMYYQGNYSYDSAAYDLGVVFGFCT